MKDEITIQRLKKEFLEGEMKDPRPYFWVRCFEEFEKRKNFGLNPSKLLEITAVMAFVMDELDGVFQ